MSFIAVLLALLIEQVKPLSPGNEVHRLAQAWGLWCARNLDAGRAGQAYLAWVVALAVPVLSALGVFLLIQNLLGWPLALAWNALMLYLCLGFRQFSFHFTEIRQALDQGEWDRARDLLAQWQGLDKQALTDAHLVGSVVESSVLAAHRHVFGVLTWFSLLALLGLGPAGAVFYRMAEWLGRRWPTGDAPSGAGDMLVGAQARWRAVDWLPARVTAISFAVVGNFEDALDGWRRSLKPEDIAPDQVILAASSGALGLQLPSVEADLSQGVAHPKPRPVPDHLAMVVGLVWRAVVMWMVLLALLTLARLLG